MTHLELPQRLKDIPLVRRIQTQVEEGVTQLEERLEELKRTQKLFTHRALLEQQRTLGRFVDLSQDKGLRQAERAVLKIADLAKSVQDKVPVPLRASSLEDFSKALAARRHTLHVPPIADYDELNVDKVADALDALNLYELEKVREYERVNKNRVTVLREIDRRLTV